MPEPVAIRAVLDQMVPSTLMAVPVAAIRSSIIPEIIWMIFLMVFSEASKERASAMVSIRKASTRRILKDDGGFFGRGGRSRSQEGEDVLAKVDVTFEEAALGADKVIHFRSPDGKEESLQVHIPAGIDSGQKIRLKGKGMPGRNGGGAGNMLLEVNVLKKPGFERKGMDIYTTVEIPFATAALGGEAIVPTLNGRVSCKIKEGTQSGTKIRLKGKGIVSMKNASEKGDEYAVIQIQVPKHLSPDARQKLTEFVKAAS